MSLLKRNLENQSEDPVAERKKAILFFSIYFVFFLVLISMVRLNRSDNLNQDTNHPNSSPEITVSPNNPTSQKNNYRYIYTYQINGNTIVYNGKKYQNKESFTMIQNQQANAYYRLNNRYYKQKNSQYVSSENPYLYSQFLDLNQLTTSLKTAKIQSEEKNKTTYAVSALDIYDEYFPDFSYNAFSLEKIKDDKIIVTTAENRITKVEFYLSNSFAYYGQTIGKDYSEVNIVLEYFDFGNISDFNISVQ